MTDNPVELTQKLPRKLRQTGTKDGSDVRPKIPCEEQIKLWVRSGGRCAFCNKYLLGDDFFIYEISLGEMAHIVGWKDSERSPRGKHDLPVGERNKADNLMLLCPEHHQIVDKSQLVGDFSFERLRKQKESHENHILHLTSLGPDRATAVIRMFGGIRGATVEMSREHAREVVSASEERYARFPFELDRQSIEIDLAGLPDPEVFWESYWESGCAIIDKHLVRVAEGIWGGNVRHLSVFALARIPLLVYLGYRLDDKVPTRLYQKHRGDEETWKWSDDGTVSFEWVQERASDSVDKVAVVLSLSGSIQLEELPKDVASAYIFVIKPVNTLPNRDVLRTYVSLENFTRCYHDLLSHLETGHKSASEIHLYPAVPITAAISLGRGIMRHAQPRLRIYDRTEAGFRYALTVNQS